MNSVASCQRIRMLLNEMGFEAPEGESFDVIQEYLSGAWTYRVHVPHDAILKVARPASGRLAMERVHLLLWWPLAFPLLFMFLPRLRRASPAILLASVALGVIIGVTEEVLWRGVYLRLFPGNLWLGLIYPAVMFGLWHICPQSILTNKLPAGGLCGPSPPGPDRARPGYGAARRRGRSGRARPPHSRRKLAGLALAGLMLANTISHVGQTLAFREPSPGIYASLGLLLPFGLGLSSQAVREGYLLPHERFLVMGLGAAAMPPAALLLQGLGWLANRMLGA